MKCGIYAAKKKTDEKALIPLPPAERVYFFCEKHELMQSAVQPKQPASFRGNEVVSLFERFCTVWK